MAVTWEGEKMYYIHTNGRRQTYNISESLSLSRNQRVVHKDYLHRLERIAEMAEILLEEKEK